MVGLNSRSRLPMLEQLYRADMRRKVLELVFWGEACLALWERSMVSNMRVNSSSNEPGYASSDHGHRSWIGKSRFLPCSCQAFSSCGFSGWYFLVCPLSSVHRFRWNVIGSRLDLNILYCPCWRSILWHMLHAVWLWLIPLQRMKFPSQKIENAAHDYDFQNMPQRNGQSKRICSTGKISSNNSCGSFRTSCLR